MNHVLLPIIVAGAVAGSLDITVTGALRHRQGFPFSKTLQLIASGALGKSAFENGRASASMGLGFHYLIALVASAIYFFASWWIPALRSQPIVSGALFGVAVHIVMSQVVLPLSRVPRRTFSWSAFFVQLVIHIFCVGIPIALLQKAMASV